MELNLVDGRSSTYKNIAYSGICGSIAPRAVQTPFRGFTQEDRDLMKQIGQDAYTDLMVAWVKNKLPDE